MNPIQFFNEKISIYKKLKLDDNLNLYIKAFESFKQFKLIPCPNILDSGIIIKRFISEVRIEIVLTLLKPTSLYYLKVKYVISNLERWLNPYPNAEEELYRLSFQNEVSRLSGYDHYEKLEEGFDKMVVRDMLCVLMNSDVYYNNFKGSCMETDYNRFNVLISEEDLLYNEPMTDYYGNKNKLIILMGKADEIITRILISGSRIPEKYIAVMGIPEKNICSVNNIFDIIKSKINLIQ